MVLRWFFKIYLAMTSMLVAALALFLVMMWLIMSFLVSLTKVATFSCDEKWGIERFVDADAFCKK
jgi:hypothetical protein